MKAPVRVDYAAAGHPVWLSLKAQSFDTVEKAVKEAQNRMARWEPCEGFRIVELEHPEFEKIKDEHIGKIIDRHGRKKVGLEGER